MGDAMTEGKVASLVSGVAGAAGVPRVAGELGSRSSVIARAGGMKLNFSDFCQLFEHVL